MARILALEWNENEARVVAASLRGSQTVFEQAFTVSLLPDSPDEKPEEVDVGARIAAALAEQGLGRLDALVVIGRTNIELRQVSVPPSPPEELPDLVRFQAMREFNALDDDWPLDYIPLGSDEHTQNVLAAVINPVQVEAIREICRTAGVTAQRMILRPSAAASLYCRSKVLDDAASLMLEDGGGRVRLLINLLASEADLTVLTGPRVSFTRCARLPSDPLDRPESPRGLVSELRRTIAAAHNQLGDSRIGSLVLLGAGARHEALAASIEQELSLPTELFDPFAEQQLGGALRRELPDRPDRFAPLLGMLRDELEGRPHAIDFLHPHRPPDPASRRNAYVLGGVAAGLIFLMVIGWGWFQRRDLEHEVARLKAELNRPTELSKKMGLANTEPLDDLVKRATGIQRSVEAIEAWESTDINWLEELRRLSDRFPDAEKALITQLSAKAGLASGELKFDGRAADSKAVAMMEERLRDDRHRLLAGKKAEDPDNRRYPEQFSNSVFISPQK
jgi:Tfp pilus assembly PilM family ATPase